MKKSRFGVILGCIYSVIDWCVKFLIHIFVSHLISYFRNKSLNRVCNTCPRTIISTWQINEHMINTRHTYIFNSLHSTINKYHYLLVIVTFREISRIVCLYPFLGSISLYNFVLPTNRNKILTIFIFNMNWWTIKIQVRSQVTFTYVIDDRTPKNNRC